MSSPRQRQVTTIIVGLCAVLVFVSLGLSAWTFVRQSQADTIRAADKKSQATSQVATCFQQAKSAPDVVKILDQFSSQADLIDTLATNSIIANTQAIEATPGDPLNKVRRESLARLVPARSKLRATRPALTTFTNKTRANSPTQKSCSELAAKLGVDPTPFQPKKGK